MNILIISFGIKEFDGRLIELRNVFKKIDKSYTVCCSKKIDNNADESIVYVGKGKYLSIKHYAVFIIKALFTAVKMKKIDILVADNMFSSIPVLVIKRLFRPRVVIQDVRELYFYEDIKKKWARYLSKCETKLMKEAKIVLCANVQRAKIMKEHYRLQKTPIVFENVRFLSGEYDKSTLDKKYDGIFKYKFNIVSTGGLSVQRKTDELIYSMKELTSDYGLFILGEGSEEDKQVINRIILSNGLKNVHLLGKVPMNELRYIVQQCDIGIVHYHKNDLNNQYCASGKIYEYLAEGLPIVTTENIPLKDFCVEHKVGEADDSFYKAILKVSTNIDKYRERVAFYITGVSVDKYNAKIANLILESINNEDIDKNE